MNCCCATSGRGLGLQGFRVFGLDSGLTCRIRRKHSTSDRLLRRVMRGNWAEQRLATSYFWTHRAVCSADARLCPQIPSPNRAMIYLYNAEARISASSPPSQTSFPALSVSMQGMSRSNDDKSHLLHSGHGLGCWIRTNAWSAAEKE